MTNAAPEVLLVGCGKMGSALLAGWLASGLVGRVGVVEPAGAAAFAADPRVSVAAEVGALPAGLRPALLVLAVKPQMMAAVAPVHAGVVERGATVLSIAAGVTLARFRGFYGEAAAVVRAMPNTPAAVGRGITVAVANPRVGAPARALCDALLGAVGAVEWIAEEALLDPVTALSGGGPAYVFLLIETLAAAGEAAGLPAALAMRLARATVIGSGELARQSPESAAELRRNVTSPNGTTLAALEVLTGGNALQDLFDRALAAAARRSRELAG